MLWASPVWANEIQLLELDYQIGQCIAPVNCNIEPEPEKQGFWASRDPWTKADIIRQITFSILEIIDWNQSINSLDIPETNPLLSKYPTKHEFNRHFTICLIGNLLIAYVLPSKFRTKWQYCSIITEIYCINNNYQLGVRTNF
jgi:hypothetical protein